MTEAGHLLPQPFVIRLARAERLSFADAVVASFWTVELFAAVWAVGLFAVSATVLAGIGFSARTGD